MSAGVCGKRLWFEEIFGTSSSPSNKRSKRYLPIRDFGFGFSILLRIFPFMDREVESVQDTHNHKIEDAIESLNALCIGVISERSELQSPDSMMMANSPSVQEKDVTAESRNPMDRAPWVDIFFQEMKSASDIDDARGRAARILEAFEKSVADNARALHEHIYGRFHKSVSLAV
ncbi:hypothetical protein MKX01_037062 [Papaver californicum]|nr:hypothetical protein MKX01_037062 [Papaver californicum]